MKFKEMEIDKNSSVIALLLNVSEKETKSGGTYIEMTLCDGDEIIDAKLWNKSLEEFELEKGNPITVEIYPQIYNDIKSYIVKKYSSAPGVDVTDFVISAPYSGEELYTGIFYFLDHAIDTNSKIYLLTKSIYEDHKEKLLTWGAAIKIHHNYLGGLLYHTMRMVKSAYMLSKVYSVDKNLLLCGAALHDIGKIHSLITDKLGASELTVPGTLFDHIYLGAELIHDKAIELFGNESEDIMLLKHLVVSHHGNKEWGAITTPAITEALLLHEIDMIDSRMETFEQELKKIEPGQMSHNYFLGDIYRPVFEENGDINKGGSQNE